MINYIISIFGANFLAHLISYGRLKQAKSSDAVGVLFFGLLNAITALCLWQRLGWSKWLALAIPMIGGGALLFTKIIKGNGTLIDYIILTLDVIAIILCFKHFIL